MKIIYVKGVRRAQRPLVYISAPSVNLEPPHISELLELESFNFAHISIASSAPIENDNFSARGVSRCSALV